jgi:outer membrane protein assembly factor BamB
VIIGTQAGKLKLVDIEKGRVVWKEDLGEKNVIYDTDWGKNGVLVTGGLTKELIMRKFDKSTLKFEKLKSAAVPDSIRCVQFNPFKHY